MKIFSFFVMSTYAQKSKGDINLEKDPVDLMNGLVNRYARFLNEQFAGAKRGEIIQINMNEKISKQASKIITRYEITNDACGHWPVAEAQGDDFGVDR